MRLGQWSMGWVGTPLIELYVIFNELNQICQGRVSKLWRNLVGNYITSLEMQGYSITLLKTRSMQLTALWTPRPHAGLLGEFSYMSTVITTGLDQYAGAI